MPATGHMSYKNCLCHKQLAEAACPWPFYKDVHTCPYFQFWVWGHTYCFLLKDVPDDQQTSAPPKDAFDPRYEWKKGVIDAAAMEAGRWPFALEDSRAPHPYFLEDGSTLLPIDQCPDRCSGRGFCRKPRTEPGQEPSGPQCFCQSYYKGLNCSQPQNEHCPNSCSGHGTCHGGWCHCEAGRWGLDCGRSKVYAADSWLPNPTQLRIYVYDIPDGVVHKKPWSDMPALVDNMYIADLAFLDQLLADWTVRTENPWEANLFYINTYTLYYIGNIGNPTFHFSRVFNYVRHTWPFWNMTGGRNHIAAATNDRGVCELYKEARLHQEILNPIKLVHFGQAGRHGHSLHQKGDPAYDAALREFKRLDRHREGATHEGAEDAAAHDTGVEHEGAGAAGGAGAGGAGGGEEAAQQAAAAEQHRQPLKGERHRFRGFPTFDFESIRMEREPCFRPEQDVAFPNFLDRGVLNHLPEAYDFSDPAHVRHRHEDRPALLYFNGYSKPEMGYSGGVRQAVIAMFGNSTRKDLLINKGNGGDKQLGAKFCLCPLGFGWGIRLTQALHVGCVPVLVQDHIYPYFWDLLPYEKFTVRVSRHNLHRLLDILEAITPQRLKELQQGMADYYQHFSWHADVGGLAYNNTITSLHRRLLNMWTALFPFTP
ncbi:hypothetical protein HYH03_001917 [Edaphochlamys debaryana]|uniref:EGF-like domain-containing protein n=1 Tax=Edaphochlamys debaryana TaxID=47281 RepID=A0A835YCC6_9CHLO|nr:hypothetical protein HYH03_001917 [Edaphochlamys debaryana]|eukprot:KAG2500342.1 hypothetical protein HYH03_001917 [Edaphochlamys debaryana]